MAVPTLLLTLATLLCASAAPAPERAPLFASSVSSEEATLYQPDGDDEGGDVVPGEESIDVRAGYDAGFQRKSAAAFDVSISPVKTGNELGFTDDVRKNSICAPIKVFTKTKWLRALQLTLRWNTNIGEAVHQPSADPAAAAVARASWMPTSKWDDGGGTKKIGWPRDSRNGQIEFIRYGTTWGASLKPGVWHNLGTMCFPVKDEVLAALATFSYDDFVPKYQRAENINLSMQLKVAILADDEDGCTGDWFADGCTREHRKCYDNAPDCVSGDERSSGSSSACTGFTPGKAPHMPHWYQEPNGRCQSLKAAFDPNTQCTPVTSKYWGLHCARDPVPQLYHQKWELNSCSLASPSDEYNAGRCTVELSNYRKAKKNKKKRLKRKLCAASNPNKCSVCATDVCA